MNVYVLETGCTYEGGTVHGVYGTFEAGSFFFNKLVEEHRMRSRDMYDWAVENGRDLERCERWLREEEYANDNEHTIVFCGTDYVTLKEYEVIT